MQVKRWALLLCIACLFVAVVSGCGQDNNGNRQSGTNVPNEPAASEPAEGKETPLKIVVTYFPYADHLFALGRADEVAGVVNLRSLKNFKVYDSILQNGEIADIGDQVDLEAILELQPDLIIASPNEEALNEQLSKIARTVTVPATLNWQETIRGVAAAIGVEEEAEAYINQFLAKQADVASAMAQEGAQGKTALFMMPWKRAFTYWSGSRMALYYEKLGFKPLEGLENNGDLTLEGISALDPEYIFIGEDYTKSSEITMEELQTDPVWNSLSAVKNNKMFIVDTEILGPLAMGQYKGLEYMETLFGKQ